MLFGAATFFIASFWFLGIFFFSYDTEYSPSVASREEALGFEVIDSSNLEVASADDREDSLLPKLTESIVPDTLATVVATTRMPFISQAPFAEWGQAIFQDACEEASMVMAARFLSGQSLSKEESRGEIVALSKFEEKKIGHSVDTSAADTEKLFREYYGEDILSEVKYDMSMEDMIRTLSLGAILIVPTNGRELKNPNFTSPGPEHHMLVVIGYDVKTKEFIVHDPGTRKGAGYRYAANVLYDAIHDYPTGRHIFVKNGRKAVIIVRKEQI